MSISQSLRQPKALAVKAAFGTVMLQNTVKVLRELGFTTEFLLSARFFGAVVIATALVLRHTPADQRTISGVIHRFRPKSLRELTLRSILMLGTVAGVFFGTIYLTNLQLAAIGLATWPLLAKLFGLLPIFQETIGRLWTMLTSVGLSFSGVALLVIQDWSDPRRFIIGVVIMLGTSACTAMNQHMGRRANLRKEDPYVAMFFQTIAGTLATSALWFTDLGPLKRIHFDIGLVTSGHLPAVWVIALLIVVMLLGFYPQLWLHQATVAPVSKTAPLAVVQLPFAAVLDLTRDGFPPLVEVCGLLLMSAGAWFAIRSRGTAPNPGTK